MYWFHFLRVNLHANSQESIITDYVLATSDTYGAGCAICLLRPYVKDGNVAMEKIKIESKPIR